MKKRLPTIILIFVFMIGLSVLLYPTVSDYINSQRQSFAVADYSKDLRKMSQETLTQYFETARSYNEKLHASQGGFNSKQEELEAYNNALNFNNDGVMAYIEIPKIKLKLPIYHGTNESVLQVGVGHFEGFSLPIGGAGTHSVLTGHRGLPSSELFTNIDKLKLGDAFSINVLNNQLTYQVDDIKVVEPQEVSSLNIESGKDYVTLVTCTPYAVNTHRLLIRGTRIDNPKNAVNVAEDAELINQIQTIAIISAPILLLILVFLIIKAKKSRRKI